ncbi:5-oxoprolinase (ATP-hydrolyzing) [Thermaerobacter marianensis DSM 12885]|uniref:5-oxoprolinase (ATP-hydrolyzing) n=1 Tax=Thermaerobacter marianensis (strain ATCC 700841 / DSM 12885 / JCM 10246 / 7p75a) TaxID=644966 RepID=E6SIT1_THEM7|nr:hydantoinase/oxoprolinase family protein [Thermaerobacter marianensis]ADU52025.1 5-oxoprolinase (ATP-hydrolyzing) [Thermaerobacter marianensis DSM 12885]
MWRVATDVGGTFTDLVAVNGETGEVVTAKAPSTPPDFGQGTLEVVARSGIDLASVATFVHGTTVVINAITQRRGARVGLITTRGFRDVLEIGRGNRPDLYNFAFVKPEPLVPRHLRLEVTERIDATGRVVTPLAADEVRAAARRLRAAGVEAVAIVFLHSYINPEHERIAARLVEEEWPGVEVCTSADVSREWREYERTSTAVLNAYVRPVGRRYLEQLEADLRERGLAGRAYAMLSGGGLAPFARAAAAPIHLLESGPVAGVTGAAMLGRLLGRPNIIAFDVGGTTAKASLVRDGRPAIRTDYRVEATPTWPGYPVQVPVVDIVEVGAGGGSIAWVDPTGAARVGPLSAGADPGPVAYGRGGTEPTLADANLVAGRYNAANYLGGELALDVDAAAAAITALGQRLGLDRDACTLGILRLAEAIMAKALRLVSLERGLDPRDFTLVAFGGTGPAHAAALAAELSIPEVVIPRYPAVFSAWGMAMADLRVDRVQTLVVPMEDASLPALNATWRELEREVREALRHEGVRRPVLYRQASMRYAGQEHTVTVPATAGTWTGAHLRRMINRFHRAHRHRYGFRLDTPVEVVRLHVTGVVVSHRNVPESLLAGGEGRREAAAGGMTAGSAGSSSGWTAAALAEATLAARRGSRACLLASGWHQVPVYDRDQLPPGARLEGPVLIEEPATVTVVHAGQVVTVDALGNLWIATGV